jgi:hypothetical protein
MSLFARPACFHPRTALLLVGGAALHLLFFGIHNAWDTVTYHVFVKRGEQGDSQQQR